MNITKNPNTLNEEKRWKDYRRQENIDQNKEQKTQTSF